MFQTYDITSCDCGHIPLHCLERKRKRNLKENKIKNKIKIKLRKINKIKEK